MYRVIAVGSGAAAVESAAVLVVALSARVVRVIVLVCWWVIGTLWDLGS